MPRHKFPLTCSQRMIPSSDRSKVCTGVMFKFYSDGTIKVCMGAKWILCISRNGIRNYQNLEVSNLVSMPIKWTHYNDVIMNTAASQITSLTIVYSTVYSDADQRKHLSSASLAFVRGIHRWPVNSLHKGLVTRKMFPFDDVIVCKAHYHYGEWGRVKEHDERYQGIWGESNRSNAFNRPLVPHIRR